LIGYGSKLDNLQEAARYGTHCSPNLKQKIGFVPAYNPRMPAQIAPQSNDLRGIYAAAVTPLDSSGRPALDAFPRLLEHLASRGCHGALLLGTTGEGPSFSVSERKAVIREALLYRDASRQSFKILAGTGCASLSDTIELTRAAFDLGVDGVVTLPAFFYKGVDAAGLAAYFEQVVQAAMPADGRLLVYHIPQVSGVAIPAQTVAALRERLPQQVYGMKDSQDDRTHLLDTIEQFPGFQVFAGSDSLLSEALSAGGVGGITALSNVTSPLNRAIWDAHQAGGAAPEAQAALVRARAAVLGLSGPAAMKAALAELFGFPDWPVRPPLQPLSPEQRRTFTEALAALLF
jgi:4-hydroxy-tetrahydrodipicolinate synthase